MAIEMRDRVKELRTAGEKKGYDLDLGVGIRRRLCDPWKLWAFEAEWITVRGNLPNLAARLAPRRKADKSH